MTNDRSQTRHRSGRLLVVLGVATTALVVACTAPSGGGGTTTSTPSSSTSSSTTSTTSTTIPPVTERIYMTDHIEYPAVPNGVDQTSVEMKVAAPTCVDYDSCSNGTRRSSGYTWFSALSVNVGPSATDPNYYGLHGGLAFGGSGAKSKMYLDWSGYCPSSLGGGPLRHGGTGCQSPSTNPTQKPHTVVNLETNRWYRLTVRSVPCTTSEVTDVTGPLTGWQMLLTDTTTGVEQSGGTWCLPKAPMVQHTSVFNEIIEQRGPCSTDFRSLEVRAPRYHVTSGWVAFQQAWGHYNGNETAADADCPNVNLRALGPNHVVDERMTPKGSNGGLLGPGYQPLF